MVLAEDFSLKVSSSLLIFVIVMLVSSNVRVDQKRSEGLRELKTPQNFPSTINCLLPFFSDTSDRVDTPDVLARKGSLFSFLLAIVYSFCSEKHEGYCGSGIPQYSSSNDTV